MRPEIARRRATLSLALIVAASALIYIGAFLLPYPLLRYYGTPLLDLGKITQYGKQAAIVFAGAYAVLFALYAAGYRLLRHASVTRGLRLLVTCAPVAFALVLWWVFPIGAIDVYDYTFYGKMLAEYHASPLTRLPQEFGQEPWLAYVGWPFAVSPYGPLWQWLSAAVYTLARGDLLGNLLGYKAIASLALLGGAAVLYRLVRCDSPERALSAFYFVAWNPLLLVETAANGHNDALMIVFILLMLLAYKRARLTLAGIALACAMLVKFPAVVVAPVFAVGALRVLPTWRQRAVWLSVTGGAALVLTLAVSLPLAEGANPFVNVLTRTDLFTTSFAAVALHLLKAPLGMPAAQAVARVLASSALLLVLAWLAWKQRGDAATLERSVFAAVLALLMLATIWFQPWYAIWIVMLAPLAGTSARRVAAVFSASVLAIYIIYDFFLWWDPGFWYERDEGLTLNIVTTALVFAPPLLVRAVERLRATRRTLRA